MDRHSAPPAPEIGWAFGAAGFVATVLGGSFVSAGSGFVLFALVFWGGLGTLFAFLVERSTAEEQQLADELRNTRLGSLGTVPPGRPDPDESRFEGPVADSGLPRPATASGAAGADGPDPGIRRPPRRPGDASAEPPRRPRRGPQGPVPVSPQAYLEAGADEREARAPAPAPPAPAASAPRRPPGPVRPVPAYGPSVPAAPALVGTPRSPREYRAARVAAADGDRAETEPGRPRGARV